MVAGSLSTDARVAPRAPSLWTGAAGIDRPGHWGRVALRPAPDVITDISDWEVGYWVAGASGSRPVIYQFDDGKRQFPILNTGLERCRVTPRGG